MKGLSNRRHVVGNDNRPKHCRNVKDLARRCFQICIAHGRVRSAEVDSLRLNLFDAAARSDRLIVNAYVRMKLAVFTDPFLIKRIRKRGAGALKSDCAPAAAGTSATATGKTKESDRCNQREG